jgi:NADH:ubiquinone oxidoreductase subunit 2 (subunit N)
LLSLGIGRDDQVAGTTALLLWSASGAMLMAGANSLMTVFLGLELLSLALYCLCAMSPRKTSRESALKYLILSSMASGFLLYGSALLFGATGSVNFSDLAVAPLTPLLALGAGLFLVGLAFKLSLVPFHVWTPDVYEGAPLPVTAFRSRRRPERSRSSRASPTPRFRRNARRRSSSRSGSSRRSRWSSGTWPRSRRST